MNVGDSPFEGADITVSEITVSDLGHADIENILNYWFGSSSLELRAMIGFDPNKMPSRRLMREALALKTGQGSVAPTILTIRVRGVSVGVHELTHIEPRVSAIMHAHIWNTEHRGRGIGAVSYVRAMERFFEAHGFQRLIFDTPSTNLAANKVKQLWGISPCGRGTFVIPTMAEPIATTRYQVERAHLAGIVERVERLWKYKPLRKQG
ncbi:hypothetical protein [Bradyrhizobium sp. USDA 336]|uniref:hypothetical protein n=1 Tax=Bradyrhizobium sp. USDA 336 TaxID=3156311 RepID=UPI003838579B